MPATIPVLATTATANNRVVEDIKNQLGENLQVIRGSLIRDSLQLQNISIVRPAERIAWIAEYLPKLPGSGIIYALTINNAKLLTAWLRQKDIDVESYYGALDTETKICLEDRLLNNDIKALVATTALGMGFDKPDLGFVIHYQRPGSVAIKYQLDLAKIQKLTKIRRQEQQQMHDYMSSSRCLMAFLALNSLNYAD